MGGAHLRGSTDDVFATLRHTAQLITAKAIGAWLPIIAGGGLNTSVRDTAQRGITVLMGSARDRRQASSAATLQPIGAQIVLQTGGKAPRLMRLLRIGVEARLKGGALLTITHGDAALAITELGVVAGDTRPTGRGQHAVSAYAAQIGWALLLGSASEGLSLSAAPLHADLRRRAVGDACAGDIASELPVLVGTDAGLVVPTLFIAAVWRAAPPIAPAILTASAAITLRGLNALPQHTAKALLLAVIGDVTVGGRQAGALQALKTLCAVRRGGTEDHTEARVGIHTDGVGAALCVSTARGAPAVLSAEPI